MWSSARVVEYTHISRNQLPFANWHSGPSGGTPAPRSVVSFWTKYWWRWFDDDLMKILTTVRATGKRLAFQLVLWMVRQLKGGRWSAWQDNDAQGGRSVRVILLQRQHLIRMTPAGFALSVRRRPHPGARIASQSLHNKAASAGNCRLPPRFIVIWVHTIHIWNIISAATASRPKPWR